MHASAPSPADPAIAPFREDAASEALAGADLRLHWEGAVSVERTPDGGATPWRIPHTERRLYPSHEDWGDLGFVARMPSGVRICVETDTRCFGGLADPHKDLRAIDVCCDDRLLRTVHLERDGTFDCGELPPGRKRLELWLPADGEFRLRRAYVSRGASLRGVADPRPVWITYGSSITQACHAAAPTRTWPAIVARRHGFSLRNLGFAGHCHLEPMVARLIRDMPAAAISICAGINIHGGSLSPRTFRAAVVGFVSIIRERHPATPLALVSPIISPERETGPGATGWTLVRLREEVAEAARLLREAGDRHLHYLDGRELLGAADAGLLPDGLHPADEGNRVLAERFSARLGDLLFSSP